MAIVAAVIAVGALTLLLTSRPGGGPEGTPVGSLEEVLGTFQAVDTAGAPAPLVAPVGLEVAPGGVFVDTGCNTGRGPAHVTDGRLVVDAFVTTRRACPPPTDAQERWVLEMLSSGPRMLRSDSSLWFLWGEGETYRLDFELVAPSSESPAPKV